MMKIMMAMTMLAVVFCCYKVKSIRSYQNQVELPQRTGVCAVATQGSSQYDTDYVTKYEIQTSLDRKNWVTYKVNGTNKVNITINSRYFRFP